MNRPLASLLVAGVASLGVAGVALSQGGESANVSSAAAPATTT